MKSSLSVEDLSATPVYIGGGGYVPNGKIKALQNSVGKMICLKPKKPLPSYTTKFYRDCPALVKCSIKSLGSSYIPVIL
jgi:hypothetical protein